MNRHWNDSILPIIKKIKPKHIVEIGSDTGINTKNILEYCYENNVKLTAIDPKPNFDVEKLKKEYGNLFDFYEDLSLNVLPFLEKFDVILIDGDHNWYTVFNELKTIEKIYEKNNNFPLIFLHDTSWPYHRRDLYYNPENIPEKYLLPYANLGISPNHEKLLEEGGMNRTLNNALFEGGEKNGVLTAIEDFIKRTNLDLVFYKIPIYHGLGILFLKNKELEKIIENTLNYTNLLENIEKYYLTTILSDKEGKNKTIKTLINEKTQLQQDNQQLTNEKTQLQQDNQQLTNEKTQLQQDNQQLTNEKTQLFKINDKLDSSIEKLKSENKTLFERTIILTQTKEDMYENKYNQINRLNETMKNNKTTIDNLNKKNNDLKEENIELKEIIKELNEFKKQIEIKNKDLSALLALQNRQNDSLNELNHTVVEQKEIISNMKSSKSWKYTQPLRKIMEILRFKRDEEK